VTKYIISRTVASVKSLWTTASSARMTASTSSPYIPSAVYISGLSVGHASISDQVTITGTGFGSSRGTSTVWFGELPQYTFSDGYVLRPCSRLAASYVSWSATQIVVTVPSMSPGLAGVTNTYHNVYVEVGGVASNASAFYIDPVTTLDASSTLAQWQAVFPGSTRTVQTLNYTNSSGAYASQHATYTTQVTLSSSAEQGNYVHTGTHDVLIKDATFIGTNSNIYYSDAGVVTMGSYATGESPANIWDVTFHNCVIQNNMGSGGGEGVNGCKVYHGTSGSRFGDWTFSDCSFGTPNSPSGSFLRASIELGEPVGGLSYTSEPTPNYLQNIRLTGCDFEPCGWHSGYSSFVYGQGPRDRKQMIDNCTFKGNAATSSWNRVTGLELQNQGFYVADCKFWRTGGLWLQHEGGDYPAGTMSYNVYRRCDFDYTIAFTTNNDASTGWNTAIGVGNWNGCIFDDCDINMGSASDAHQALFWGSYLNSCTGYNFSTSYLHGYIRPSNTGSPTAITSFWQVCTDWTVDASAAAALLADNQIGLPHIGDRP